MITEIEQLRIESKLTEQFRIYTYPDGTRIVAANGYVMDYAMFSCMLIWMLGGGVCHMSVMSKNDHLLSRVKKLNPTITAVQDLNGYSLVKHLFSKIGQMLSNSTKTEISDLMMSHIENNKLTV